MNWHYIKLCIDKINPKYNFLSSGSPPNEVDGIPCMYIEFLPFYSSLWMESQSLPLPTKITQIIFKAFYVKLNAQFDYVNVENWNKEQRRW